MDRDGQSGDPRAAGSSVPGSSPSSPAPSQPGPNPTAPSQASLPCFTCTSCHAQMLIEDDGKDDPVAPPPSGEGWGAASSALTADGQPHQSFVMLRGGDSFVDVGREDASSPRPRGDPDGRGPAAVKYAALEKLFALVSNQTDCDQPLCVECAQRLSDEMQAEIKEVEQDCQAYEAAIERLSKEERPPGAPPRGPAASALDTEEDFQREVQAALESERAHKSKVEQLEKELAKCRLEQKELESEAGELDALERKYWSQFNTYMLDLGSYCEEKDALLSKIEQATCQLELLKRTNVFNDAFHIWHDGSFGTINNFRLGRTSEVHVEWDEINAAWGQAVLLLHTMVTSTQFELSSYRLLPMGSYPRISDGKNTYELYGPVTQFLHANYDKAMVCFLACVQEFSQFAAGFDAERQAAGGRRADRGGGVFELPYKIEGDKICGHTIRLRFNSNEKWTKSCKYMLANLKVLLVWLTSEHGPLAENSQPASPMQSGEVPI